MSVITRPYTECGRASHNAPLHRVWPCFGQLEEQFKVEIEQVGIDDCLFEATCRGSCHSRLRIFDNEVHRVQTNTSSVIGTCFCYHGNTLNHFLQSYFTILLSFYLVLCSGYGTLGRGPIVAGLVRSTSSQNHGYTQHEDDCHRAQGRASCLRLVCQSRGTDRAFRPQLTPCV